jgi:hypothetical protein
MPESSIAPDVHQPLDVHLSLAAEGTFNFEFGGYYLSNSCDFFIAQFAYALQRINAGLVQYLQR